MSIGSVNGLSYIKSSQYIPGHGRNPLRAPSALLFLNRCLNPKAITMIHVDIPKRQEVTILGPVQDAAAAHPLACVSGSTGTCAFILFVFLQLPAFYHVHLEDLAARQALVRKCGDGPRHPSIKSAINVECEMTRSSLSTPKAKAIG